MNHLPENYRLHNPNCTIAFILCPCYDKSLPAPFCTGLKPEALYTLGNHLPLSHILLISFNYFETRFCQVTQASLKFEILLLNFPVAEILLCKPTIFFILLVTFHIDNRISIHLKLRNLALCSMPQCLVKAVFINWKQFCFQGNINHYLKRFLIVMISGWGYAADIY